MLGATVRLKDGDGTHYRVRRDGINNFGRRELRLRALDGGPLLFVEPDDVEIVNPSASMGLSGVESEHEDQRQEATDGGDSPMEGDD